MSKDGKGGRKMEKLRSGKWNMATSEEFAKAVEWVRETVRRYNWQDKVIRPYSFAEKVEDFIYSDGWTNYEQYTGSSRRLLISEVNGMIEILEHWIATEEEEKVTVRIIGGNKDGQIEQMPKSMVNMFLDSGLVEVL